MNCSMCCPQMWNESMNNAAYMVVNGSGFHGPIQTIADMTAPITLQSWLIVIGIVLVFTVLIGFLLRYGPGGGYGMNLVDGKEVKK